MQNSVIVTGNADLSSTNSTYQSIHVTNQTQSIPSGHYCLCCTRSVENLLLTLHGSFVQYIKSLVACHDVKHKEETQKGSNGTNIGSTEVRKEGRKAVASSDTNSRVKQHANPNKRIGGQRLQDCSVPKEEDAEER